MNLKPTIALLLMYGILVLSGCRQTSFEPKPLICGEYKIITTTQPNCIILDTGVVVQTPLNQQTQLIIENVELTIKGTTYIQVSNNNFEIIILEGTTIIGIENTIRTLKQFQQVSLDENLIMSRIMPLKLIEIAELSLDELQRPIELPSPTPTLEIIYTAIPNCPRPEDWTEQYQVQSGDTLTKIAQRLEVTLEALQTNNCINNPNNLQIEQILWIPQDTNISLQPNVTYTPSVVFFRADQETLTIGECTMLRWDVQNIYEIQLSENIVSGQINKEVCPTKTTTYTLTVRYFDETESQHQLTIIIIEP